MGAGHRKDQGMIRGLGLFSPTPQPPGGEGLKVKLIISGQCVIDHAYIIKPPLKTQKDWIGGAARLNIWRFLEGGAPGECMGALAALSMHVFHLVFIGILYNIL